jgi:hypothetical protein
LPQQAPPLQPSLLACWPVWTPWQHPTPQHWPQQSSGEHGHDAAQHRPASSQAEQHSGPWVVAGGVGEPSDAAMIAAWISIIMVILHGVIARRAPPRTDRPADVGGRAGPTARVQIVRTQSRARLVLEETGGGRHRAAKVGSASA